MIRLIISGVVIVCGLAVLMISSLGLFRFSTTLNRVHTARTDLFGTSLVILGVVVLVGAGALSLKLLAVLAVMWAVFPMLTGCAAMAEIRAKGDLSDICDMMELREDGELKLLDCDDGAAGRIASGRASRTGSAAQAGDRQSRRVSDGSAALCDILSAAGGNRSADSDVPDLTDEILSLRRGAESGDQGVSE